MSTLSVYAKGLPEGATEAGYLEKIRVIGVDPFILFSGGNGTDITRASLPPVDSSDIVSYLVLQTSFITYLNVLVLLLYYVYCYYCNVQHNLLLIL